MIQVYKSIMRSEKESRELLPEIIREILSWLPIKPLVRSQLVCKEWQAVIISYHFMEKHRSRLPIYQCHNLLIQSLLTTPTISKGYMFTYLHVFDGLMLMKNLTLHKYVVWNPAAHRVLELPDPLHNSYGLTLSVVPATGSYKIVLFYNDTKSGLLGCQVLTLGQAMAWRQLTFEESFPFHDILIKDAKVTVVSLGRVVHCVVLIKAIVEIVTLDVETESFTLTRLPTGAFRDLQTVSVIDWNGKLAFSDVVGQDLELMVLEDHKKEKWCREKEVIPLPFLENEGFKGKILQPLFGKEGRIWFYLKYEKIFTYKIETRTVYAARDFACNAFCYQPSFVTFEGMRQDKQMDFLGLQI